MEQLPYPPTPAVGMLSRFQSIVIAGTTEPIAVFGFPNSPSRLLPDGVAVAELAGPEEDVCTALEALAEALNAPKAARLTTAAQRPPRPSGALTPRTIAAAIGALLPENAIIVNEAVTTGFELFRATAGVPRHTLLGIPGGALGGGLPAATGAAVARPESKVIAFEADGGAMYAVQSLWTQAREQLDVVTLICSNRCYRILRHELARVGIAEPGPKACALTDLSHPDVDFVHLARGMGVPAVRVENAEDLTRELERALSTPGPKLIEMMVA